MSVVGEEAGWEVRVGGVGLAFLGGWGYDDAASFARAGQATTEAFFSAVDEVDEKGHKDADIVVC